MRFISFVFTLFLCFSACGKPIKDTVYEEVSTGPVASIDYEKARVFLFGELYYNNGVITDVYCEQNYDSRHGVGRGKIPLSQFLNCEHTWPQSKFSGSETALMKVDLHHLYPVSSPANSARGNKPFAEINLSPNVCNMSTVGKPQDLRNSSFEPPINHRGNVARAMFYFSIRYKKPIDSFQEKTFRKWHKIDPVDSDEIERNKKIKKFQGNSNTFIEHPEYVDQIVDF